MRPSVPAFAYQSAVAHAGVVSKVAIRGNDRVDDALVREMIATRVGEPLDRARVRDDVQRIWALEQFDDVAVHVEPGNDGLRLTYAVRERPLVTKIFVGGDVFQKDVVERITIESLPRALDPAMVDRLRYNVAALFRDAGYLRVKVHVLSHAAPDGGVDLCLRVEQGPRAVIDKLTLAGNSDLSDAQLLTLIDTSDGAINAVGGLYLAWRMERDALSMQAHYYDHGYITATVGAPKMELSKAGTKIAITIAIEEGPQFRLASLVFDGPEPKLYQKAMRVQVGDIFNRSQIAESLRAIERVHSDRGQRVRAEPETKLDHKHDTVEMTIRVIPY